MSSSASATSSCASRGEGGSGSVQYRHQDIQKDHVHGLLAGQHFGNRGQEFLPVPAGDNFPGKAGFNHDFREDLSDQVGIFHDNDVFQLGILGNILPLLDGKSALGAGGDLPSIILKDSRDPDAFPAAVAVSFRWLMGFAWIDQFLSLWF